MIAGAFLISLCFSVVSSRMSRRPTSLQRICSNVLELYKSREQGKIERYRRSMKNRILLDNYYLPGQLEHSIERSSATITTVDTTRAWTT